MPAPAAGCWRLAATSLLLLALLLLHGGWLQRSLYCTVKH
jgi:hypothetical protein